MRTLNSRLPLADVAAISFVDKIVFGKWNYSRAAGSFSHAQEFYRSMSQEVIRFGRRHGIDTHIKEGTPAPVPDTAVTDVQVPTPA